MRQSQACNYADVALPSLGTAGPNQIAPSPSGHRSWPQGPGPSAGGPNDMHDLFESAGDPEDHGWQDHANCLGVDPDLFFPERGASTREAKEVCRGCVVRDSCLEYALVNGEKFGIWGGMSERERRRIRRQRALARRIPVTATASAS